MELFKRSTPERIGKKLLQKEQTIAVAESVTAGLLQFALSTVPDASSFFQGGITAYNIAQKYKHLQVEPIHALRCNCVSQQVSSQMALQVCIQFSSNWGIGITGYATPVPESDGKLFAYYAIVHDGKVVVSGRLRPSHNDDPLEVQRKYTEDVLAKLATFLKQA